jgi:predicted RNA-binding Zn-ribbon protein involved in translation (DUF1610 family)
MPRNSNRDKYKCENCGFTATAKKFILEVHTFAVAEFQFSNMTSFARRILKDQLERRNRERRLHCPKCFLEQPYKTFIP